jgi:hypothetical protein
MTSATLALPKIQGTGMAKALEDVQKDVLALNDEDRDSILRTLVEQLDGPPDTDVEKAWLEDVQRRSRELDEGIVTAIPADEVFARIRADLKR